MAFDGIVTKAIVSELQGLCGARIDKIYEPNKNNIVIGCYLSGANYAINICIDSQFYRINLTTNNKQNPQVAPNFSMLLRKYLLGLRLKNVVTLSLERVVILEFEGLDDIDDLITRKLVVELMGKHSNVILLDDSNIIIDSLRHTKNIEEGYRNILPHTKYEFPKTNKLNFLELSDFADFKSKLNLSNITLEQIPSLISNTFNGISKSFICSLINNLNITDTSDLSLGKIFNSINSIIENIGTYNLDFKTIYKSDIPNDFYLVLKKCDQPFCLNFFIDDFYYTKETTQAFKSYRDNILKIILEVFKKYSKRLININEKLKECDNMETYRLYGELITANLYKIKQINVNSINLENYYDNNNLISIPLNKKYSPSINAKRYFKKYNKLKNALKIVSTQKEETLLEINYIESVIYELESANTLQEVVEIYEEISENIIFKVNTDKYKNSKKSNYKKSKLVKNKKLTFNPIKYKIEDYTLLIGRNNKENDYLSLKYSQKTDLWFHTKDIHGSHAILMIENNIKPSEEVLVRCAQIAAYYSKAKNSGNVPVDFCEVKYVKKPNGAKPGMVIYSHNRTLFVDPKC